MQKHLFTLLTLTLLMPLTALADIDWSTTDYDFGIMKEALGPQTGSVTMYNHTSDPTYIRRVRPSCGCTDASYTESVVLPGDSAIVTFTYDPTGRPGKFSKTVKIFVAEDNDPVVVHIHGTVVGTPATLEKDYPVVCGPLRMQTATVDFGDVRFGSARHAYIKLYNLSEEPLLPVWSGGGPAVEPELATAVVEPGDVGMLSLYLNTLLLDNPGELAYTYEVKACESCEETVDITVKANVIPDTSMAANASLASAPSLRVAPAAVDVGKVGAGKVKFTFSLVNDGKSPLRVLRVAPLDPNLKIKRIPDEIKPGCSSKIEGTLDTSRMHSGPFRLYTEILTDDPLHTVVKVPVAGERK